MTTLLVRTTSYTLVAATQDFYQTVSGKVFGHVADEGWPVQWAITRSRRGGPALASGSAFTRDGAWGQAIAAAHRPGITDGAR